MQEIRCTFVRGNIQYFLVETYLNNGKNRQRVLANLGRFQTVEAALTHWQGIERSAKSEMGREYARDVIQKLSRCLPIAT